MRRRDCTLRLGGQGLGGARSSSISGALHRKSAEISTRRGGPRGFRCWLQGSLREPGGLGPPAPPPAWEEPRRPQPHSTAEPGGASGTEARDAAGPSARSATLRLHVPSSERSKSQNLLAQAETPPSCPPLLPFSGGGKPHHPQSQEPGLGGAGTGQGPGAWAVPELWPGRRGLTPLPQVRPVHHLPSSLRTA